MRYGERSDKHTGSLARVVAVFVLLFFLVVESSYCSGLLSVAGHYFAWGSLNKIAEAHAKSRGIPAFQYPVCLDLNSMDTASDYYVRSYIYSLGPGGGAQARSAHSCEKEADKLVFGGKFDLCIERMATIAQLLEYGLDFPFQSEVMARCVVSQCRRRAEQARLDGGAETIRRRYLNLADKTILMASIFRRHQKMEIADRAYQDAIASAALAAACRGAILSREDGLQLQTYFLAYASFLYGARREEDALAVLAEMDRICP